jgi:hypothetical protein
MPVPPQIGQVVGHHDEVAFSRLDETLAPGAHVSLAGCVGLHRGDDFRVGRHTASGGHHRPNSAHSTSPIATAIVAATMSTSARATRCWRKGLKPTAAW